MMPPNGENTDDQRQRSHSPQEHDRHPPVDLGKLESDEVQRAALFIGERRRFTKFFGPAEFSVQRGHDFGDIQFEQRGVGPDEAANVNRGRKCVKVAFLEGANVVGANFGDLGDLVNGEAFGLSRQVKLFGNRCHPACFSGFLAGLATPQNPVGQTPTELSAPCRYWNFPPRGDVRCMAKAVSVITSILLLVGADRAAVCLKRKGILAADHQTRPVRAPVKPQTAAPAPPPQRATVQGINQQ